MVEWGRVDTVVFDVDGTLYDQGRMRRLMLRDMALACLARPRSIGFVRILAEFRRCREALAEAGGSGIAVRQYEVPARRLGVSPAEIERIVEDWMGRRPLAHLDRCRHRGVAELFDRLRRSGRTIGVFSDHAVGDKLSAMGLRADITVSATDPHIDRLKPDPAGLLHILQQTNTRPERCLMIGDRDERDGAAARRASVPALIRGRQGHFRSYEEPAFLAMPT